MKVEKRYVMKIKDTPAVSICCKESVLLNLCRASTTQLDNICNLKYEEQYLNT